MFCEDHNLLFVHIPKTAGTTVEMLLKPYASDKVKFIQRDPKQYAWDDDIELHITQRGYFHTKHWTLQDHIRGWMLDERVNQLETFTVVRNPYERMLKLYLFKLQHGEFKPLHYQPGYAESKQQYRGKHITNAVLAKWNHKMFTEFLEGERNVKEMGARTYLSAWQHCQYQGRMAVKHILKYENFETDLRNFFDTMNLEIPTDIPITNTTVSLTEDQLKELYNSHNRKIIETRYDADFETFGYEKWK